MAKSFVVVCYDVPSDRRRVRLHKLLMAYGTPVQYSVFECLLEERDLERMKKAIARAIKPRLDNVRYYYLCASCQKRIETTRAGEEDVHEADSYVV